MAEVKVKQEVKVDGSVVTMSYPELQKTVRIDVEQFPAEIRAKLQVHGMKQIAVDCGAGKTAAEACAMLERRLEAFMEGAWRAEGERDNVEAVISAVLRAYRGRWTEEQLRKAAGVKPEQVKLWRADAKVKLELAKERERKAREAAKQAEGELEIEGLDE